VELLERCDQLSALDDSLDAVIARAAGTLVLVGCEAGVGKTVLLQAFCERRRGSARILWGACEALLTAGPLGPLFDLADVTRGELEELVSRGARPHEVTAALIRELAGGRATILVIEDLHWADEATLDVLRLLARKVQAVPALVLASYRSDELDRGHPLMLVLGELATTRTVTRLGVAPLSADAVGELAEPHAIDAPTLPDEPTSAPAHTPSAPHACVSARTMRLHWSVAGATRLRAFEIIVNGRSRATLAGSSRAFTLSLRGRPAQKVRVQIRANTKAGARFGTTRNYVTCSTSRLPGKLQTLRIKRLL
jgi:AAA ATPase-like protein